MSLDLVETGLQQAGISYLRFDGTLPQKQRQSVIESFRRDPKLKVFLLTLSCGAVGLVAVRKVPKICCLSSLQSHPHGGVPCISLGTSLVSLHKGRPDPISLTSPTGTQPSRSRHLREYIDLDSSRRLRQSGFTSRIPSKRCVGWLSPVLARLSSDSTLRNREFWTYKSPRKSLRVFFSPVKVNTHRAII